ncbi:hypothetical protein OUZ56_030505 [Daphnia magna]|uniref:Uncharacterized protein n=1 Tax=Daphnia magna TaxID=35525 RepID=A0ABQ9ZRI2_9CRUS|nr:hypothetical protein OUZ56_030505 [Daphnia magna]
MFPPDLATVCDAVVEEEKWLFDTRGCGAALEVGRSIHLDFFPTKKPSAMEESDENCAQLSLP